MTVGSFFRVDLDALQQVVNTLQESEDHMRAALEAMASSGDGGQIGTDALNRAADDFQSTWQYGLGQLGDAMKDTKQGVGQCHDAYEQVDDGVAGALDKLNGAVGGAP